MLVIEIMTRVMFHVCSLALSIYGVLDERATYLDRSGWGGTDRMGTR